VTDDELDERITEWHEAPAGSPIAAMELHEYLGMTLDEFTAWVPGGEP
jgi:hypothetical protein